MTALINALRSTRNWLALGACLLATAASPLAKSEVRYYHTDVLGSVAAISDEAGNIVERREFDPHGAQLAPSLGDGPNFTGHVADSATGLVQMQDRYFDPVTRRFLSVDAVRADPYTGASFNRYAYANNNPQTYVDPDGRHPLLPKLAVDLAFELGIQYATTGSVDVGQALADTLQGALNPLKTIERAKTVSRIVQGRGGMGPVKKGEAGVARSRAAREADGLEFVADEITVATPNGRTRIDLVFENAKGELIGVESKNGPTARLNPNQAARHQEINAGQPNAAVGRKALRAKIEGRSINRAETDHWTGD